MNVAWRMVAFPGDEHVPAAPVLAHETAEPIAVEPVLAEAAIELEQVEAAPAALEPVAESVTEQSAIVASADLVTPVEDFVFVPMDEPVDPNAVPDMRTLATRQSVIG